MGSNKEMSSMGDSLTVKVNGCGPFDAGSIPAHPTTLQEKKNYLKEKWKKLQTDWSDITSIEINDLAVKISHAGKTYSYVEYLYDGMAHREDGPAVEWNDGYKEWWKNDKIIDVP